MNVFKDYVGFPGSSAGKESTCNAGDPGSIPGLGRSPGEGIGYPLQYLAWEMPRTEEPDGPQSMGRIKVGPHSVGPRFPGPLLIRTRCPDTSPNSSL